VAGVGKRAIRVAPGVELCAEAIGDPADPAIILIGGAAQSMDWWEDELCDLIAGGKRFVIRYDHRDTGESTSYPAGKPGYLGADLVTDAIVVLDAFDVGQAHVVGLSMGAAIGQELALRHGERVASLTLMSTSPVDPSIEGLPGTTPELAALFAEEGSEPDWGDRDAVVAYLVDFERALAGPGHFDELGVRTIAGAVFDRSRDMAATMTNHFALDDDAPEGSSLGLIDVPTLVLHGTHDPLFPLEHGKALAEGIPGARLIELEEVGHQMPPAGTWPLVVRALIEHTSGSA
jgi:pimeloyl-ACP methyl ester carboxylesterase